MFASVNIFLHIFTEHMSYDCLFNQISCSVHSVQLRRRQIRELERKLDKLKGTMPPDSEETSVPDSEEFEGLSDKPSSNRCGCYNVVGWVGGWVGGYM